ncbi:hypothetical protein ACQ4PT_007507 [Festuca glaucescens]
MEATASASASAPHLLHCGGFGRTRVAGLVSPLPRRRRLRRVLAVATEPRPPQPASRPRASAITSTRFGDVSQEIKRVRKQMEEDEQLASLMRGLRGSNLRDDQFADKDVTMRLVEVTNTEGLPLVYSPEIISAYWGKRPGAVATRVVQLLSVAGGFISGIISDLIGDKIKENEVTRAIELREIVTSLGPAYIKLGQALSIRPDILSPAAMTELQKLCDKVPSFPDDIAMALLEEELGKPWQEIYSELSPSPIAAASLGQVYKGRLKETGELVAVKVQRPFVLETVTIDLFIIRNLGLVLKRFPQVSLDVVGLVDEWAARFFEELDYINEGENGLRFAEMMREDLPQVVVPKTYPKYTSRKVLTTGWIDGEKLSQSTEDDVGSLVNVGVICYLKQLLDTGFFHADPHPGNMIRTPDGKLAILDFGLVTKLTDDQKYGMIEAIAHLIHRDYDAIVKDFVKLGFIPEGVNLDPILPVLAKVFDQALEGGGAKNINFQELAADLAQITFDYPFRIPPYFALIIRAIGVLEAKSGGGEDMQGNMAGLGAIGFQPTTGLVPAFPVATSQPENPVQARAALGFLLSARGDFFREFILDEIVKAIDAVSREQLLQVAASFGIRNPTPVFGMVPVRSSALLPTITEEDRITLNNVEKVVKFLTAGTASPTVNGDVNIVSVVQELLPVLPSISSKILPDILSRLSSRVFARVIREAFL